jgi:hypothetical protein
LIEAILRYLPGGTEAYHENPRSGYPVSRSRFKPRTSDRKFTSSQITNEFGDVKSTYGIVLPGRVIANHRQR